MDAAGDELDEFGGSVEDAAPFAVKASGLGKEMPGEVGGGGRTDGNGVAVGMDLRDTVGEMGS